MSDDELTILLIEDNPGDARLIEEMLRDERELLQRIDPDAGGGGSLELHHETRVEPGVEFLDETDVGIVLLDLNLPDSSGLETLETVTGAAERIPVVVLTGLRDQRTGIEAIQRGAQDYLVKDEVTSDLLIRSIHHAIERKRQEIAQQRRREQLEALNRLNRISQDITHLVITTTSREDLEQRVCDRLVESDGYRFAWIGTVNRGSQHVAPSAAAGVEEGYLDEISITVDDSETGQGPAGEAVRTHEVQVMQNVHTDPRFEPWREQAAERGYESSAAIPIVYEDLLHGVLNVYSASPHAFSDPETEILGRLGDVIGHAITALERKDALVSDAVLELEFLADGFAEDLVALTSDSSAAIGLDRLIRSEEGLLAYGSASGLPREEFQEAMERSDVVDDFRLLTRGDAEYEFELATTAVGPLIDAIATHGGRVRTATIDDGEFRFLVEFPRGRDTRQLVELVEEHCPGATCIAQRTVDRGESDVADPSSVFENRLTEKQRLALETAYFAGYFDWPRDSTGEEIAERLGISPATFNQHLRTVERKFFDAVFEG